MGQIIHKFTSNYRALDVNLRAVHTIKRKKRDLRLILRRQT